MNLGHRALARDWAGVHGLLAPWLERSMDVDAVRRFFEDEYRLMLKHNGIEEMHYPEYPDPELDGSDHTNATSLRRPMSFKPGYIRRLRRKSPIAIFVIWLVMRLQCSDEQMEQLDFDHFAEVWMAVVETSDGLRVGYWSQAAYRSRVTSRCRVSSRPLRTPRPGDRSARACAPRSSACGCAPDLAARPERRNR
jgi:hypothetical protein